MDIVTDGWLRKMPLQFFDYWAREDADGDSALTQYCPSDYLRTMAQRAHERSAGCWGWNSQAM